MHFDDYRKTRRLHLFDRGSYTNGRAVKILYGYSSMLNIYMCKFQTMQLVVLAAEGKIGFVLVNL